VSSLWLTCDVGGLYNHASGQVQTRLGGHGDRVRPLFELERWSMAERRRNAAGAEEAVGKDTSTGSTRRLPAQRLLTKAQAAAYCGVCQSTFDLVCPVRPITLGPGTKLRRLDVRAIDRWLDDLSGDGSVRNIDWLALLEREHGSRSR
jgi:hypothetical protein